MEPMHQVGTLSRSAIVGALAGLGVWAWAGATEAAIVLATFPGRGMAAEIVPLGGIAYGLFGALVGAAIGILGARRLRVPAMLGLHAALWCLGVLGAGLIFRHLPRAIGTETALAAAGAAVGAALMGAGVAWLAQRLRVGGFRWGVVAFLPWVMGAAVLLVARFTSSGGAGLTEPEFAADRHADDPRARPNVLFLLVDTLRADRLGVYGHGTNTSPAIDSLATQGVTCERAIAASSWTRPSVATIFSGLSPAAHGLTSYYTGFSEEALLLPEMFKAAGYTTAVFSNNGHVSPTFGFAQGVDFMSSTASSIRQYLFLGQISYRLAMRLGFWPARLPAALCLSTERLLMRDQANDGTGADLNRQFFAWLDRRPDKPFFAYLHYFEPHAPYAPPAPWDARCNAVAIPGYRVMPPADRDQYFPFEEGTVLANAEHDYLWRRYDAEIRYQDAILSEVFAEMRHRSLAQNTLVVFTSDHGEEFGDHGHWGHGKSLFGEVTQVPLIWAMPGEIAAGARFHRVVEHIDVAPTVLDLVGLELAPGQVEGRSRAVELRDASPGVVETSKDVAGDEVAPLASAHRAMSQLYQNGFEAASLRDQAFLYIEVAKRDDKRVLLYDLVADPACQVNVAEARRDVVMDMAAELRVRREVASPAKSTDAGMGEETMDRLKALGYIN